MIEAVITAPRSAVAVNDRTRLAGKLRANSVMIGYDVRISGASSADSDGDGMPDGWETVNGLNPALNDADGDLDGDGLKNFQEYACGTKAFDPDTDDDGLRDGPEYEYWGSRTDGIEWDSDVEPYSPITRARGDGLHNIVDPDSDDDGFSDGVEVTGWDAVVQWTSRRVTTDPAKPDTDMDGILDGRERDGLATDFPNYTVNRVGPDPRSEDRDGDGIEFTNELVYGLDPNDVHTTGYAHDAKIYDMIQQMGEWAVSPKTGHLNPQLSSTATCILGATMGFGDEVSTALDVDREMEFCVFLPQDGRPVTIKLDFVYEGVVDPDDRFYDVKYSGAVYPHGSGGAPAIISPVTDSNSISWRIGDPLYNLMGDYFINFSYHYDKDPGE